MEYLAQTTAGGCGPCSFLMVARHFGLAREMTEALDRFSVQMEGPRCFATMPSFHKAADWVGLKVRLKSLSRDQLRRHLGDGPVILLHRSSDAENALPHFSVAISASDEEIVRNDPGFGPNIHDTWERFEGLWDRAKVSGYPERGNWAVLIRPHFDD